MTIEEIIAIANEAYPDGKVQQAFEAETGSIDEFMVGDTLAVFIARELKETFNEAGTDEEQLATAERVMRTASDELHNVLIAFDRNLLEHTT